MQSVLVTQHWGAGRQIVNRAIKIGGSLLPHCTGKLRWNLEQRKAELREYLLWWKGKQLFWSNATKTLRTFGEMTTFAGTIQLALWTKIKNGGMAKVNVTFIWGLLSRSLLFFLATLNVNFVWSPDILFDLGNFDPLSGEYMQSGVVCGGSWGIQKNLFPSLSFSRWFPNCGGVSFFLETFLHF